VFFAAADDAMADVMAPDVGPVTKLQGCVVISFCLYTSLLTSEIIPIGDSASSWYKCHLSHTLQEPLSLVGDALCSISADACF
jgi:hypothetical protein